MFYELITEGRQHADRPALICGRSTTTWAEMAARADSLRTRLRSLSHRRVGVVTRPTADLMAALAALDDLVCDVFLLDEQLEEEGTRQLVGQLRLAALIREDLQADRPSNWRIESWEGEAEGSGQSSVTILTSGTSGKPKAARHGWDSLARPVRRGDAAVPQRWLLTYRPQLYAGLQVVLQCFLNYGTLVVPTAGSTPSQIAQQLRDADVQYGSATPSYWRRLVLFADPTLLRQVNLRQITLGGEVIDQQLLDALRDLFPQARVAHIYATTELGRCFSVTDGQAGFPTRFLDQPGSGPARDVLMTVRQGELFVRSANAMESYDRHSAATGQSVFSTPDGWTGTGDLVDIQGDRVHFVGRRSDLINVGGNKVSPLEVEQVIRHVPGVADVRVYAKPSSIAGQLVSCEIVPSSEPAGPAVKQAVLAACREQLAPFQRPRFVEIVDEIQLTDASKRQRRET